MKLALPPSSGTASSQPRFASEQETLQWDNYAVLGMALAVTFGTVVWAFLVDRGQYFDEIGLFNVPYMYVHYGIIAYPAHWQYHSMIIHPPIHYWILGVLMKLGLGPYYAEAFPPLFFALLSIALICRSRFSAPARVGLLLALCVPLLFRPFGPSMRPDVHRTLALFAGLLALEDARLRDWDLWRLFVGSGLLTYASALHYPGFLAWTGVLVYVVWVMAIKGWHDSQKPILSLIAGGAIVGIPYLAVFVLPHLREIRDAVSGVPNAMAGASASWKTHLQTYAIYIIPQLSERLPTRVLFRPMAAGIPAIIPSTLALLISRQTRGLALASLPYPLFLLVFMTHKLYWPMYFLLEFMLYVAGVGLLATWAVQFAARRVIPRLAWLAIPLVVLVGTTALLGSSDLHHAEFSLRRRFHEAEIARASGRRIMGPNALVGSRNAIMWYAGGGFYYFDVGPDLLNRTPLPKNLNDYFSKFDAIVEPVAFSYQTNNPNRKSITSWYADGTLKLRGFYLSSQTVALPHLLLSSRPVHQVEGYGVLPGGRVAQFQQSAGGASVLVAAICGVGVLDQIDLHPVLRSDYLLPSSTPSGSSDKEVGVLMIGIDEYRHAGAEIARRCVIRDQISMNMQMVDTNDLLTALKDDQLIHFYEHLEEALDARYGPEANVSVTAEDWPDTVTFLRDRHQGKSYHLLGPEAREIFRSDMDNLAEWQIHTYGKSHVVKILSDGLRRADHSARFSSGTQRDDMASPFKSVLGQRNELVFFSIWTKPARDDALPSFSLQDQNYTNLARARPLTRRKDGWVLLFGWTQLSGPESLRVVVQEDPGVVSMLDKAYVAELPSRE